jgi:hypothetical protein
MGHSRKALKSGAQRNLARRKRKIRKKKEGTEASPEGEGAPFGLINAALQ